MKTRSFPDNQDNWRTGEERENGQQKVYRVNMEDRVKLGESLLRANV